MGEVMVVNTGRHSKQQEKLNMERCAEFLARMIQKYGDEVLAEIAEEKKAGKVAR